MILILNKIDMEYVLSYVALALNQKWVHANKAQNVPVTT